jgi:hypothetical protein
MDARKRHSDAKVQEFVDVEMKEVVTSDDSSQIIEEEMGPKESSMNTTKWLACAALALSYSTAIQQHACTATIVKHIDAALGEHKGLSRRVNSLNSSPHRSNIILQLDDLGP